MNRICSLVWKEWREARAFLFIALFAFLGLPLIGAIEARMVTPRFGIVISPWVMTLGGVLAVFVAVGVSRRDLAGRLEDFWRSRPIGIVPSLVVKYLVGLAVVLVSCMGPIFIEQIVDRNENMYAPEGAVMLVWGPFLWIALYSLGFLAAVLLRRTAHAAMLGLAVLLLVYFLPLVLPPLKFLSITHIIADSTSWTHSWSDDPGNAYHQIPWMRWRVLYGPAEWRFVGGMLSISLIALIAALISVRRDWRIESGQKMMYWSVGSAVLILFASASFQLAENLPILGTVDIQADERVLAIQSDGHIGVVLTGPRSERESKPMDAVRRLKVTPTGVELSEPIRIPGPPWRSWNRPPAYWIPEKPNWIFLVEWVPSTDPKWTQAALRAMPLDGGPASAPVPLWPAKDYFGDASFYAHGDRLYVMFGAENAVIDISQPSHPRVIQTGKFDLRQVVGPSGDDYIGIHLAPLPGLDDRDRLLLAFARARQSWSNFSFAGSGEFVFAAHADRFITYRLKDMTKSQADYEAIGHYQTTLLEQVFGVANYHVEAMGPWAYFSTGSPSFGVDVARLTVFDVSDSRHPYPAGHFAVPDTKPMVVCPLPDGRALLGGKKLYLVGPPPKHG